MIQIIIMNNIYKPLNNTLFMWSGPGVTRDYHAGDLGLNPTPNFPLEWKSKAVGSEMNFCT